MAANSWSYSKPANEQIEIVIPSRGRSHNVERMEALLPESLWCVPRDEEELYREAGATRILLEPAKTISSISQKRQFILDTVKSPVVVQCDDDLQDVWCMAGRWVRRVDDPNTLKQILYTTAIVAMEAGAPAFGFNQNGKIPYFKGNEPFLLKGALGSVMGFVKKGRWTDPRLRCRCDVDMSLSMLLSERIIWIDNRYYWSCDAKWSGVGGAQLFRNSKTDKEDEALVLRKWGQYVSFSNSNEKRQKRMAGKSHGLMSIKVRRKIPISHV